jgi:hypothetical protein
MPQVGFELTILVFERAKTVHALDREATVFGSSREKIKHTPVFVKERIICQLFKKNFGTYL